MNSNEKMALYKAIVEFAQKNPDLRIGLVDGTYHYTKLHFNLSTTGATVDGNEQEPTLTDIQNLPTSQGKLLPFDKIHIREDDSGPGLANIKFLNGQFEVSFPEDEDERIHKFCSKINSLLETFHAVKITARIINKTEAMYPPAIYCDIFRMFSSKNTAQKLEDSLIENLQNYYNNVKK